MLSAAGPVPTVWKKVWLTPTRSLRIPPMLPPTFHTTAAICQNIGWQPPWTAYGRDRISGMYAIQKKTGQQQVESISAILMPPPACSCHPAVPPDSLRKAAPAPSKRTTAIVCSCAPSMHQTCCSGSASQPRCAPVPCIAAGLCSCALHVGLNGAVFCTPAPQPWRALAIRTFAHEKVVRKLFMPRTFVSPVAGQRGHSARAPVSALSCRFELPL